MIDEKYQDLMNRAVDEALTPEEQAELDDFLKSDPEAQRQFDRLRQVANLLSQMPQTNAPADFKSAVMASIRPGEATQAAGSPNGLFARIAEAFRSGRGWRYTYAFSAGIACGILVLAAVTNFSPSASQINSSHVSGTLGAIVAETTAPVESQNIEINDVLGAIEVRRGDGTVVIEGDIPGVQAMTCAFAYDSNDLTPAVIWQPEPYTGTVSTDQGVIDLRFPGSGSFTIVFRDRSPRVSTIICQVSSGGMMQTLELKTESAID